MDGIQSGRRLGILAIAFGVALAAVSAYGAQTERESTWTRIGVAGGIGLVGVGGFSWYRTSGGSAPRLGPAPAASRAPRLVPAASDAQADAVVAHFLRAPSGPLRDVLSGAEKGGLAPRAQGHVLRALAKNSRRFYVASQRIKAGQAKQGDLEYVNQILLTFSILAGRIQQDDYRALLQRVAAGQARQEEVREAVDAVVASLAETPADLRIERRGSASREEGALTAVSSEISTAPSPWRKPGRVVGGVAAGAAVLALIILGGRSFSTSTPAPAPPPALPALPPAPADSPALWLGGVPPCLA